MDADEIRKWHNTFKRDGELFEIRILGDTWTQSGYFYDVEVAIQQLALYDSFNIYYTINKVKDACASRAQFNCFKPVKGTATSKQDIECRCYIPIDIDCERPSGVSSSDEEKEKAYKKAQDVFRFLRDNGFSEPVVCDSSSGYHLLYPINAENNQESEDVIKTFLNIMSKLFTDDNIKIDDVLYDANRILRLPGSHGRKGRDSQDRPHRLAKILSVPAEQQRMFLGQIDAFNHKYEIKTEQPVRQYNGGRHEDFNLSDFIHRNGIGVDKEIRLPDGGTKYILTECCFDSSHKAPDAAIFEMPNGAIAYKCFHQSCSHHTWHDVRMMFDPHAYDLRQQIQGYQQPAPTYQPTPRPALKEETPELGSKWLTMSKIEKVDITNMGGFKTGFTALDKRIVKLFYSELTIISGNNGAGKSSLLNTLMLNAVDQGVKTALWTGELRADVLKTWLEMVAAGKRNLYESSYAEGKYYVPNGVSQHIDEWLEDKLFVYNNEYGSDWGQLFHDMKEMAKMGVKFFVLDNLYSLNIDIFDGEKNDQQKELVKEIKEFAKKEMVHVLLVAHPRKVMTFLRKNDISGTSDIQNAADNIGIIHRTNKDFFKSGDEFFGKGTTAQYSGYGNVLEWCKNRLFGVCDLLVGLVYEEESRRFLNFKGEDKRYGWEAPPVQQEIPYEPPMPFESTTENAPF